MICHLFLGTSLGYCDMSNDEVNSKTGSDLSIHVTGQKQDKLKVKGNIMMNELHILDTAMAKSGPPARMLEYARLLMCRLASSWACAVPGDTLVFISIPTS
jgi:hypothetical protein